MIAYFDTSAFLKLILTESGSKRAQGVWRSCELAVSSVVLYAECRAGLAMAGRMDRLADPDQARQHLDALWPMVGAVIATVEVVERAGEMAEALELQGYDAVHLASAELLGDAALVFASADQRQSNAASKLGMGTAVVL